MTAPDHLLVILPIAEPTALLDSIKLNHPHLKITFRKYTESASNWDEQSKIPHGSYNKICFFIQKKQNKRMIDSFVASSISFCRLISIGRGRFRNLPRCYHSRHSFHLTTVARRLPESKYTHQIRRIWFGLIDVARIHPSILCWVRSNGCA